MGACAPVVPTGKASSAAQQSSACLPIVQPGKAVSLMHLNSNKWTINEIEAMTDQDVGEVETVLSAAGSTDCQSV